ncbi:MAG: phosphotransferase [Deltaproteobacteria bacterium]|jgi:aminoglycoside/choline kinase family phosphotransferase|nr:phosphotransferase [Deltaproteobacteria bacterium]
MEDFFLKNALQWAERRWGVPPSALKAVRLAQDASQRAYYRVDFEGESRVLLIGPDARENLLYLLLGRQLWYERFPLPRIYDFEPEQGFFLLEDLGESRLDRLVELSETFPYENYQKAIEVLATLHLRGLDAIRKVSEMTYAPYLPEMVYHDEWLYFCKAVELLKTPLSLPQSLEKEAHLLCGEVSYQDKPVLMHRDFQSRNLIFKESSCYILDWQGARLGTPYYDLGSLLFDPYISLSCNIRESLLAFYVEIFRPLEGKDIFVQKFYQSSLMRLFQAIGAYANLTFNLNRPQYGKYIPKAMLSVSFLVDFLNPKIFPRMRDFLKDLNTAIQEGTCSL